MIRDKLIPRLRERFPDRRVSFGAPPGPVAVYAAEHVDIGDVEIFDDGSEVTLVAGRFTHGHFADYVSACVEEAEGRIVEDVVSFLERLFADRVVMWGSHAGGGGWHDRDGDPAWRAAGPLYLWSGPLAVE
jgi:hypothetical protein